MNGGNVVFDSIMEGYRRIVCVTHLPSRDSDPQVAALGVNALTGCRLSCGPSAWGPNIQLHSSELLRGGSHCAKPLLCSVSIEEKLIDASLKSVGKMLPFE